ncbi:HD-GYP domain-containing protein [Halobacteriovorax sp. HLS]|uniref:HD-GYP domain-containing protein n=1 Tax=Halobacteriovorax sp. HLS TaxID=2234000 RepID=UPI000FD913A8|nr:HD domain-containing phosphohydrolase [Halobacteriovorax sp. HLS]
MKLLFSTPDHSLVNEIMVSFKKENMDVVFCANGKETQLKLSSTEIDYLILDSKIQHHSFLFVVKFCRINNPMTEIILTFDSKKEMEDMDFTEAELIKLGIHTPVFAKNYIEAVHKIIKKDTSFEKWKVVKEIDINEALKEEVAVNVFDSQFTKIAIKDFYSGNTSIFDVFLKLNKNKYLKILNQGESFNQEKLKKYKEEHNLDTLYFKTEDRSTYINYINDLVSKSKKSSSRASVKKSNLLSSISEKYLEEIYTKGLNKNLYQEGVKICDNIYNTLSTNEKTSMLLKKISEHCTSHHFLTSIFAVTIAKRIDWAGRATINNLSLGSMLHDVGMCRFKWFNDNPNIPYEMLSTTQKEDYLKHPEYGYEMLQDIHYIPEAVRQIVLQHHEYINGTGFPNQLTSQKIYPLAKIVSLADYMSTKIIETQSSPMEVLRQFIPNQDETSKFEPQYIKALIRSFVDDE